MRVSGQATEEVQRDFQRKGDLDGPLHWRRIATGFVLRDSRLVDANRFTQLFLRQIRTFSSQAQTVPENFFHIHAFTPCICENRMCILSSRHAKTACIPTGGEPHMNPIRRYRKAQGWTQGQLAQRIGRSFSYVSHLEKGDYKPGRDVLLQLAELFRVEPSRLLAELSVSENAPRGVASEAK